MEKLKSDKERRKDLRLDIVNPFLIKFHIARRKNPLRLYSRRYTLPSNISASGILVELSSLNQTQIDRIIEGKDKLILELDIPAFKRPFKIEGKIIWFEKKDREGKTVYIAGISFEGIKDKDREILLPLLINLCLKGKANI